MSRAGASATVCTCQSGLRERLANVGGDWCEAPKGAAVLASSGTNRFRDGLAGGDGSMVGRDLQSVFALRSSFHVVVVRKMLFLHGVFSLAEIFGHVVRAIVPTDPEVHQCNIDFAPACLPAPRSWR